MQQQISWQKNVPIFRTSIILKQLGLAIGIPFGAILLFIGIAPGKSSDKIYAFGLIGALLMLTWIFVMVVYRGEYQAEFILDAKGALCRTQKAQAKKNKIVNMLTVALGLLAGKPSAAGAGVLAASRQTVFLTWKNIKKVKYDNQLYVIQLCSSPLDQVVLFCQQENYQEVMQFVQEKMEQKNRAN